MRIHCFSAPANSVPVECYSDPETGIFVTIRAYRGSPFAANAALNDSVVELLRGMRLEYGCWVGAYCLMPNHLHFLASPVEAGSSVLTLRDRFKGKSTNHSWPHGCRGRLWQSRSYDGVALRERDVLEISEYILENPVRAGLVSTTDEWRWSGIFDSF